MAWFCTVTGESIVKLDDVRLQIDKTGLHGILGILRAVGTSPEGW
jgi:hypothetical protein